MTSSAVALGISVYGGGDFFPGDPGATGFPQTVYLLSALTFDVWIAGTIAYVLLWLENRRGG